MAKPTKSTSAQSDRTSAFPVPFSLEAFRKDVLEVFLHYVRIVGWITDEKTALKVMNFEPKQLGRLFDPEMSAGDLGLSYEDVRGTQFAKALDQLYEFAFFGRQDLSAEAMEYESYYMWVSDLVQDAYSGSVTDQWDSYGGIAREPAKNCLLVAETANARVILEGGEPFSYFSKGPEGNDIGSEGALTIRQMALLSGMEEMSIRAAANKKRANPLVTHSKDGGTRVAISIAKEWLTSKGRYIPVVSYRSASDIDLSKRGFTDCLDLWHALNARCLMIVDRDGKENSTEKLAKLGLGLSPGLSGSYLEIDDSAYADERVMRPLAELLELPPDLLILRCKETVAKEQLAAIEHQLRQTIPSGNSSSTD